MDGSENRPEASAHRQPAGILDEKTFSKYFLLIVFILSLAAFIGVIRIFILEVVLAAVFTTLFYPLFRNFMKLFGDNRNISAFATCIVILLCLLIPIVIISNLVVLQAIDLYHTAVPQVREIIQKGNAGILGQLRNLPLGRWLDVNNIDWQTATNESLKMLASRTGHIINRTSRVTITIIIDLFIILFSIFYFLRDGERILKRVRTVVPLSEEYKDRIVHSFKAISRATVRGILLIALIQSFLATMTLWFFNVEAWLLWGVIMLVFAVIPFVGTGAVLIPTGIIQIVSGHPGKGIAIICISVFVVSTIDNFLRPRLVGRHAGMHDLIVFFSSIGGIATFGPAGFIVGPLIAAIFLTILDIFSIEFQEHLEYSNR